MLKRIALGIVLLSTISFSNTSKGEPLGVEYECKLQSVLFKGEWESSTMSNNSNMHLVSNKLIIFNDSLFAYYQSDTIEGYGDYYNGKSILIINTTNSEAPKDVVLVTPDGLTGMKFLCKNKE